MTSDDQFFFDYVRISIIPIALQLRSNDCIFVQLASVPHDVRRYANSVAEAIDRHVDHVADAVRDTLSHQSWLPPSVRPSPIVHHFSSRPQSLYDRLHNWVIRNRAWSAAILAFVGTTGVLYFGDKKLRTKRRKAKRSANGARKEIIGKPRGFRKLSAPTLEADHCYSCCWVAA
jgi:hypothetical protein